MADLLPVFPHGCSFSGVSPGFGGFCSGERAISLKIFASFSIQSRTLRRRYQEFMTLYIINKLTAIVV